MPQKPARTQPLEAGEHSDILIVGQSPDGFAIQTGRPFAHAQETILNNCLHQAGLIRAQVGLTNFIWDHVKIDKFWKEKRQGRGGSNRIVGNIDPYKQSLWRIIQQVKPRVIVPLGDLPTYILTKRDKTTAIRGYPFKLADTGIYVVPSLEPGKMVFGNHEWRWYLAHDLRKARRIAENSSAVIEWSQCKLVIPNNFAEACALLDHVAKHKLVAWDIEISDFHTSCMGFCYEPRVGISIPLDMRWTEREEHYLWVRIARILEDESICKIIQNGVFDVQFMYQELGIFVKNYAVDTMTAHHIMYPDFRKSLEFLASIHTFYPYWKDELVEKTIKDES
jgi:uracil-DNA glycosylase family 4